MKTLFIALLTLILSVSCFAQDKQLGATAGYQLMGDLKTSHYQYGITFCDKDFIICGYLYKYPGISIDWQFVHLAETNNKMGFYTGMDLKIKSSSFDNFIPAYKFGIRYYFLKVGTFVAMRQKNINSGFEFSLIF